MLTITYHSHSCFTITSDKVKILTDPFIKGNPLAKIKPSDLKPDLILVSHGHGDHVGDTVEIAKRSKCRVIAPYELIVFLQREGVPADNCHAMHIGGSYNFDFGRIKLTPALHGSAFVSDKGTIYTGNPCGYLITLEGQTIYFAGDTGLSSDMKLTGENNKIKAALLPIGGNFTMDIEDAVKASDLLDCEIAIPMHYNTFDVIKQDPYMLIKALEDGKHRTKGVVVGIEETFILE